MDLSFITEQKDKNIWGQGVSKYVDLIKPDRRTKLDEACESVWFMVVHKGKGSIFRLTKENVCYKTLSAKLKALHQKKTTKFFFMINDLRIGLNEESILYFSSRHLRTKELVRVYAIQDE